MPYRRLNINFFFLRRNYNLQEDGDRLRYIREALKIVANLNSPTEREHYLKDISSDFDYSYENMKQELSEIRLGFQKKRKIQG